jgi:NAD(P)-dependent dehydrogenase (short-subunit alcohol dehydrogenase family)
MTRPIDVWNVDTFDGPLIAALLSQQQLLLDYFRTDRANYLEREASDHRGPPPSNPFAGAYYRFAEGLVPMMERQTIRAWHHTRMTDREVETARRGGLYPATLATLRTRLEDLVAMGELSVDDATSIFAMSPFQGDALGSRHNRFWMTSHPHRIDDGGVTSLLAHWGGESAYFSHRQDELLEKLSSIGLPRVLEVAVPLALTPDAYSAAKAAIHRYARSLGCHADWGGFDLYTQSPLDADALLRVNTLGEPDFALLARGYPTGFRDRFGDDS